MIKNTRKPATLYYGAFGNLIFEADSYLDISCTAQQGGYFYLNGHTLNVNIATNQDWCCLNGSGTNGTIVIRGEGVFHSYYTAIVASTVTVKSGSKALAGNRRFSVKAEAEKIEKNFANPLGESRCV